MAAKYKLAQRCNQKEEVLKTLTIQARESSTTCQTIEIFIRATGIDEWFIRSVFNFEVSLHWYLLIYDYA